MPDLQELLTERLRLRPLHGDDARSLHVAYADADLLRHWHRLPRATEADTAALLADEVGANHVWAICWAGGDEAIGHVGFATPRIDPSHPAPFGYLLRRDVWGQGVALEAASAALAHGFTALGAPAAELWIYDGNTRSRALAERLGGVHRGAFWGFNLELRAARYTHVYEVAGTRGPLPHPEITRLTPLLTVPDVAAAIEWWRDRLGFRVEWALDDPPTVASMVSPGWLPNACVVRLRTGEPHPARFALAVPNGLDDLAASLGVDVVNQPWGMREVELTDPWGHTLVLESPG